MPRVTDSVEKTRQALRQQMPIVEGFAYFDHAAVAPITRRAHDAVSAWADDAANKGIRAWGRWDESIETTRMSAATLINCSPDEIAFVPSTTAGIMLVAEGFPFQEGDNVVTLADEFPSNRYPWVNLASRGVTERTVATDRGRLELDDLAAACDDRTRIVSVSWVSYATGYRHDLAAIVDIAHCCGALLLVDAIQGLGAFPLDVTDVPIDFLAADGHKWMLGPEGGGIFYIRKDHLDRLRPLGVGWHSVKHERDFDHIAPDWKQLAERYEGGSPNSVGITGLGGSLQVLLEVGPANIAAALLEYTNLACEKLQSAGATIASHRGTQCSSGIVAFELPGVAADDFRLRCLRKKIVVNCRQGRVRISPHAYNNAEELGRLITLT